MNRFLARTGAVGVACAMWTAGALAGSAPAESAAAAPEVPAAVLLPTAQTAGAPHVIVPGTITVAGDVPGGALAAAAPVPVHTTGTVIPLPPGVYVGLVGLASAAIARRRYMKRR